MKKHTNFLGITFIVILSLATLFSYSKAEGEKTSRPEVSQPQPRENFTENLPIAGAQVNVAETVEPVTDVPEPEPEADNNNFWTWVRANLQEIILAVFAFLEIVVRLTPTDKDNSILSWLMRIIDTIFPNRSRTGGKFNSHQP